MTSIMRVSRTPESVLEAINLRGWVIPAIDLRLKFRLDFAEKTYKTCIIVIDADGSQMGLHVDKLAEVLDIPGKDLEYPPCVDATVISPLRVLRFQSFRQRRL